MTGNERKSFYDLSGVHVLGIIKLKTTVRIFSIYIHKSNTSLNRIILPSP